MKRERKHSVSSFEGLVANLKKQGFRELTEEELFTVNGGKKKSSSSSSSSGNSGTKNTSSSAASAAVTAATSGARTGKNIGSTNSNNKSNSGKPNNSTSSNSSSSSNNSISSSDKNSSNGQNSYTVQSGETLSQITANYNKEHGTNYTYQQVAEKNGISNPDVIHPGQQISFGDNSQTDEQPAKQHSSSQNNSNSSHGSSGSDFYYENATEQFDSSINYLKNELNNEAEKIKMHKKEPCMDAYMDPKNYTLLSDSFEVKNKYDIWNDTKEGFSLCSKLYNNVEDPQNAIALSKFINKKPEFMLIAGSTASLATLGYCICKDKIESCVDNLISFYDKYITNNGFNIKEKQYTFFNNSELKAMIDISGSSINLPEIDLNIGTDITMKIDKHSSLFVNCGFSISSSFNNMLENTSLNKFNFEMHFNSKF